MKHGGGVWHTGNPYDWIDFSANLRPDGPPSWIREAVHDAQKNIRFYPDADMRRAGKGLARFLDLPEACVLPVAGGIAAIDLRQSGKSRSYLMPSCLMFVISGQVSYQERTRADHRHITFEDIK